MTIFQINFTAEILRVTGTMTTENILGEIKNKILQNYEYISNDPEENADNFHPKWALFRETRTDEERYKMLRKNWGSREIPDPRINLTCREVGKVTVVSNNRQLEANTEENYSAPPSNSQTNTSRNKSRKYKKASRLLSRSCTGPYEKLISNLEKDYQIEYFQLMFKHRSELQEMLQYQLRQTVSLLEDMHNFYGFHNFEYEFTRNLEIHQKQLMNQLLMKQNREWQHFMREKSKYVDACRRYMEEVKAFLTFYQKINDGEITLQMTDEQFKHTVETEKMYSLYSTYYNK